MHARPDRINVAATIARTAVEGPGWRYAIWVQGCPMRCPGCCNPELLPFVDGDWRPVSTLLAAIRATSDIEGITLLGGEPFVQAEALAALCRSVRDLDLGVMVFTGFSLETLRAGHLPHAGALLAACDLLIDGPFVASRRSRARRFVGSDNQGVHLLSSRYRTWADDWPAADGGVEVRLRGTELSINGEPRDDLPPGLGLVGPGLSASARRSRRE